MLAIVTALRAEADPLIERFSLRKDIASHGLELFRSSEIVLAISGIGRVRAATIVGALCHCGAEQRVEAVLNLGIAGCTDPADLGTLFLIHKVQGPVGSRTYLPDMVLSLGCQELPLMTVDTPMWRNGAPALEERMLIDMEGNGVCEAASHFLPPSRIQLLKVASDNLQQIAFSRSDISVLISAHILTVENAIFDMLRLADHSPACLSAEDQRIISSIAERCCFSWQQRRMIRELAMHFRVQRPDESFEFIYSLMPPRVQSKQQAREVFNAMRSSFEQSSV